MPGRAKLLTATGQARLIRKMRHAVCNNFSASGQGPVCQISQPKCRTGTTPVFHTFSASRKGSSAVCDKQLYMHASEPLVFPSRPVLTSVHRPFVCICIPRLGGYVQFTGLQRESIRGAERPDSTWAVMIHAVTYWVLPRYQLDCRLCHWMISRPGVEQLFGSVSAVVTVCCVNERRTRACGER